jgi:hypothetical protein
VWVYNPVGKRPDGGVPGRKIYLFGKEIPTLKKIIFWLTRFLFNTIFKQYSIKEA